MSLLKSVLAVIVLGIVSLFGVMFFFSTGCACSTKEMAWAAAMKSDLRNLVTVQEEAFAVDSTYRMQFDSSRTAELRFYTSTGVTVTILEATREGWRAEARHTQTPASCAIAIGRAQRDPRYTWREEGMPVCIGVRPRRTPFRRWLDGLKG